MKVLNLDCERPLDPFEDKARIYAGWGLWEMHVIAKLYRLLRVKASVHTTGNRHYTKECALVALRRLVRVYII